ncbi:MAG: NYN domain-containing protein [Candidatus Rokubacteria bacterium]|nr:NYN domain-containing protein [Candidatus Rokubacteria bacterium]
MNGERKLALFIDFENIARGVKEAQYKQFEIKLVLERLLEKGKIIVRRAYADWNRFTEYKRPFHEWAIELIDVPQSRYSGKNSADIRMVVDALDLAYGKTHIDSFALVSGDSDFSPLVSKLLEEAAKQKIVTLERDEKSGTYIITALTEEGGRAA